MSTFGNRNAPTTSAATARKPASKYAGITGADTRDPMLGLGEYRVQVMGAVEGRNPKSGRESYKVTLSVIAAAEGSETPVGATCAALHFVNPAGLSELKRLAVSAAGFGPTLDERRTPGFDVRGASLEGEAQYDALDESCGASGAILEATAGHAVPAPTLVGRRVDVVVGRGKDVPNPQTGAPTGDYFRTYAWGSVPDSEQPAPAAG